MGKSAQLGLHTWLPDAMEGPTPVSALIHAATMVTAGVFMVCRCGELFHMAPIASGVVTIIGATTALFAATVGLARRLGGRCGAGRTHRLRAVADPGRPAARVGRGDLAAPDAVAAVAKHFVAYGPVTAGRESGHSRGARARV